MQNQIIGQLILVFMVGVAASSVAQEKVKTPKLEDLTVGEVYKYILGDLTVGEVYGIPNYAPRGIFVIPKPP